MSASSGAPIPLEGWQGSTGISGSFQSESVATFAWNRWQVSTGISGNFRAEYAVESIQRESELDGIYVIRTSEPKERLSAADTVRGYKHLALVEQLFRTLKGMDIRVRPMRHRITQRVRAHIFLYLLDLLYLLF